MGDSSVNTISSRFERQVASVPDNLAFVSDEISLSYRALDLKANRIAASLASIPSDDRQPIILFMNDEMNRLAAMLGALKADRIFIPLSSNSPEQWIDHVIKDSHVLHIIVDRSTLSIAELAANAGVTVIEVEHLETSLTPFVACRAITPDSTAYIVYTSGSTGRPKGVASSHRRLIRSSDVRNQLAAIGCEDRYANLRSSGVSSWIRNSLSPLLAGACLFPFNLNRHGLHNLTPWLIANKITYVTFSGSLLRTWLSSLPNDVRFPSLRFVGATGERLYGEDVVRLAQHLEGDWRIGHTYSSTETGTIAAQVFTSANLPDTGVAPVGRPVEGAQVSINNEMGAIVPFGEIGEIVVRSRFLAQGYWNNPTLTAKVFETDPLNSGIRIYHTGDLGRWRNDGTLELVARKGRRIRLHGYNIEPFEVECELVRQPGVRDAVVVLRDPPGSKEPCLVGYVVAPPNVSASEIRNGLFQRLPSYMVPSHIIALDSFPILASGKIDHAALPTPFQEEARAAAFRLPSNDREHKLLRIWQDVLKIPKIGIDDEFFDDLGGTSLRALELFLEIETQMGCSLPPSTIVQAPTIARLAEFIGNTTGIAASQLLVPLRISGRDFPLFLAHDRAGLAMSYRHLVSDLQCDRPIYGLQPPPLDGKHSIPRSIESMAASCVAEIRRVQPRGPYFLAGHSFGGRLSFEIAQQFANEGERVRFLGLIDTSFRDMALEGKPWVSEVIHVGRKIRDVHNFKELISRGLRYLKWNILRGPKFVQTEWWFRKYDFWIRQGRPIPHEYRPAYYERLSVRANRSYVPRQYFGHITMFSSKGNSDRQKAHWQSLSCGGLTVLEVPAGHHEMILPPYSKFLAEKIDFCLNATALSD